MDFLLAFFLAQRSQPIETLPETYWIEVPGTGFAAGTRTPAIPPVLVSITRPVPNGRLVQILTPDADYGLLWVDCQSRVMMTLRQGAFIAKNKISYSSTFNRIGPNETPYWRTLFNFACRN